MIRQIRFDNVYLTGDSPETIEVFESIEIRDRDADESDVEWDYYLDELLWPLTGTGNEVDDAGYFATSVDDLEPKIYVEWC